MIVSLIGKQTVEIEIDEREFGNALLKYVMQKYLGGDFDDAGCDWLTKDGKVYIGSLDWLAIDDSDAATLVDAVNILKSGKKLVASDKNSELLPEGDENA
jgi:hypothetical protein